MPISYRNNQKPIPLPSPFIPEELSRRLGSGIAVPLSFNPISKQWDTVSGADKVKQNILVCLRTPINRRLGQADYGSELPLMIFEEVTQKLRQQEMIRATRKALEQWVPNIIIENVLVDVDSLNNNIVVILIEYMIAGSTVLQSLKVAIADDSVQLPPNTFKINGRQLIKTSEASL